MKLARANAGAVVVVVKAGAVVYARPFGLANAEAKTPMHVDSMFRRGCDVQPARSACT